MLEELRQKIDKIDDELVALMAKRFAVVKQIGDIKKQNNLSVLDKNRFLKVLENVKKKAEKYNISKDFIEKIYNEIHNYSCELEK